MNSIDWTKDVWSLNDIDCVIQRLFERGDEFEAKMDNGALTPADMHAFGHVMAELPIAMGIRAQFEICPIEQN